MLRRVFAIAAFAFCGFALAWTNTGPVVVVALACLALMSGYFASLPHRRRVNTAIAGVAFFAAAPVKVGQFNIADAFFVLAAGLLVLERPVPREWSRAAKVLLVGIALIAFGGIVGSRFPPATNPFPHAQGYQGSRLLFLSANTSDLIRFMFFTAGMLLLVRYWRPTRREGQRLLWAYGCGAIVSVLWGLASGGGSLGRLSGLTAHPVFFGWISAMTVFVGIAIKRPARLAGLATSAAGLVGVLTSGTRGSALIVLAGICLLPLGRRSLGSVAPVAILVLVVAAASTVGAAAVRHSRTIERLTVAGAATLSNNERAAARDDAWKLVRARPLTGGGFHYFSVPHNLVLGVWTAGGIVAVVGLAVIVAALIGELIASGRRGAGTEAAVLAGAVAVYLTGWAVNPSWDRWLWLPIALAVAGASDRDDGVAATDLDGRVLALAQGDGERGTA